MSKELTRKEATERIRFFRRQDIDPVLTETYEDSPLIRCSLCLKEAVGTVEYTTSRDNRQDTHELNLGVSAVLVDQICRTCENKFKRNELPKKRLPTEAKHDREYIKFLNGDLYPEIKVTHTRADKTATAKARLKSSTKFYK